MPCWLKDRNDLTKPDSCKLLNVLEKWLSLYQSSLGVLDRRIEIDPEKWLAKQEKRKTVVASSLILREPFLALAIRMQWIG